MGLATSAPEGKTFNIQSQFTIQIRELRINNSPTILVPGTGRYSPFIAICIFHVFLIFRTLKFFLSKCVCEASVESIVI